LIPANAEHEQLETKTSMVAARSALDFDRVSMRWMTAAASKLTINSLYIGYTPSFVSCFIVFLLHVLLVYCIILTIHHVMIFITASSEFSSFNTTP